MTAFALTWDYRCPFARIVHEHVLDALDGGAPFEVHWAPFSLGQAHVPDGGVPIWERPTEDSGLLALQAGVAVRDHFPEQFRSVHRALFEARHAEARQLDEGTVRDVLGKADLNADAVLDLIAGGEPLATVRSEHEAVVASHEVWGVPTFIIGDAAVFVRLMERSNGDAALAQRRIERVLDQITGFPELNEFKHTTIPF
jgi:2-hydroxychromene-2-carboxylate isomerase